MFLWNGKEGYLVGFSLAYLRDGWMTFGVQTEMLSILCVGCFFLGLLVYFM